ncbi:MAG: helix-turn-helix domain-containing protein [Peptococcaceae bacterium]|nr:helix-turn-helix domain-containing protein [Peptococcaceae bacterium]
MMRESIFERFDFTSIGQAIKTARSYQGITREKLAEMLDLAPRYIMAIENQGQHPSFQVFYELITMFNILVDQYLFPENPELESVQRQNLYSLLDSLDEKDLIIIESTVRGIIKAKTEGKI